MDDAQIKNDVLQIVSELLGKPIAEINEESRFVEDLGADSLDNVELVMEIEKKFNVEISDEKAMTITSVGEAIKHIQEHFKSQNAS